MLGSEPVRESRVMKNDSFPLIDLQYAAGFPAGRIVSGAAMWQIRAVGGASRDARDDSSQVAVAEPGTAVSPQLSRKVAAGWLAAALLFTGAGSPPVHAAASGPPEDAAPEMFAD